MEDWLFVVADGPVRVHIGDRTLAVLAPGRWLASSPSSPRRLGSASATALEPTLLLRLRRGPFEELLEDRPEIAGR